MSESVNVAVYGEVRIEVLCSECCEPLNAKVENYQDKTIMCHVSPCEVCAKAKHKEKE